MKPFLFRNEILSIDAGRYDHGCERRWQDVCKSRNIITARSDTLANLERWDCIMEQFQKVPTLVRGLELQQSERS